MEVQMITVVTLVDNELVETYVGAVDGSVSEEDRAWLASKYEAHYGHDQDGVESDRDMYFREVELHTRVAQVQDMLNASDQGMGGVVRAEGVERGKY
jgi:hypothetical protein